MGGRRRWSRLLTTTLAAGLVVAAGGAPAAADEARPTVDPGAPTPTAPQPGGPPQGFAPDGTTVGGDDLDTRGLAVADDAPPLPPEVAAAGWLVADLDTGEVLATRDPHGRYYPASTLKTLTVLTLLPLLDPDTVVRGTTEDEQIEGSRVGLVEGGEYPVSLLFEALVLQSGNDAANALARTAGGVEVTLEAMNETAEAIGAYDTVAGTPSGLDVAGQSSSPYDLALIFRALLELPAAAEVLRTPLAEIPAVPGKSEGYQIQNQNPLLTTYEGNLGGKTGFTDAARHTFVTAAERHDRRLVVSIMQTESSPLRAADQAALLLDWGFALPAGTPAVGELIDPPDERALIERRQRAAAAPVAGAAAAAAAAGEVPDNATGSPLVGAALAVTAVLIIAATLVGRRRAVRPVPPVRAGGPPARPGVPPVRRPPAGRTAPHRPMTPPRSTVGSRSTPP
jgi:D-alanyl-D-alanine carboxypeptidase (penicillin-binding protein 5/6)